MTLSTPLLKGDATPFFTWSRVTSSVCVFYYFHLFLLYLFVLFVIVIVYSQHIFTPTQITE